jgi:hypothetical protein
VPENIMQRRVILNANPKARPQRFDRFWINIEKSPDVI